MDKNKSRTDLLAAGRKKLQQFRQKKDNGKGSSSSSHGKSSKKSGKLDSDSNASSVASKPTGLPEVLEGDALSLVDSRSGDLDSSVSGSLDNPVDPDSDIVAVDIPLATESGLAGNEENPELHMEEMLDIGSSGPNQGKSVDTYGDQGVREALLDNPEVPDFEGVKGQGDTSSSVDLAVSSSKANSADGRDVSAETDSIKGEQEHQLVSQEEGDQEADGLCTSSDIEHDRDGRILVSEPSEIAETKQEAASGQGGTGEATSASIQTGRTDDESAYVSASNIPDGLTGSALAVSQADITSDLSPGPSNVENSDARVQSGDYGDISTDGVQESNLVAETYSQQYMPEDSFIFVEKNHERSLSPELTNSSEGYHLGFSYPISIPQLVEVIKGLPEDEFRFLLNSRESDSDMELGNSPPYGLHGSWERIKEELFLTSCLKDVLHMQLTEQTDIQIDKDLQFSQLKGELCLLHASLEEAYQRNTCLSKDLSECKSELKVTVSEKEELQHKLHAAKAEVDEVCARGDELQNSLERSHWDLSSLSKELADCKNSMVVLHVENESLNGTLASLIGERNKLVEEKDSFLNQIEKLLRDLADCKNSLDRSHLDFSSLSKELADCKNSMAILHAENESLNGTLSSLTEERNKLVEEKDSFLSQNEKLLKDLAYCENSLERSHSDLSSLSKELADCKNLMAVENESLNGTLASLAEERNKLVEEKDSFLNQNEKLLKDLDDCKNLVAALQVECSELSGNLASVTEERNKVEGEKESLACGHEKLSLELSNLNELVEALHLENANLSGKFSMLTEEREKLEEQNKILVQDNDKLSSQLLVLGERFSKDCEEREHLEVELKEMTMRLEKLREENLPLGTSLEMHKSNLREIGERQAQLLTPKGGGGNKAGSIEVLGRTFESGTDHDCMSKVPANRDGVAAHSMLEESQSEGLAGIRPSELFEPEVLDNSLGFMVTKRRVEEAAKTLQKLEKAMEDVHSHSSSFSRSGGKMGSPAVSKLIQAFEWKVHRDEQEAEEMATQEDQLLLDSFASTNELIGTLKLVLKQLATDAENSILALKREQERSSTADLSLSKLKVQFEDLEDDSVNVEATNIELLVLYEAVKSYAYDLKERNNELEVLYETLQQENGSLKAESCELGKQQSQYKAEVEGLQMQLHEMQLSSNEKIAVLRGQLENFQEEAADKASTVEQEWNATIARIVEAVQRLDDSCRHLISSAFPTGIHGNASDAINYVAMSVNTGIEMIEDLKKKLEAEQEASINLSREANEKCSELLGKNELANETLQKLYSELWQLVSDSCGSMVTGTSIEVDLLPYTVDYSKFKDLVEQLRDFLAERLHLQSVNSKLSMELTGRIKEVEELNSRCLDLSCIQKLIEDVEGVLKQEDARMELDKSPVSRLASLVSFLVRNYKEVQQQEGSSREEFGDRMIELTDLQEKIQRFTALNLQQDNEILLLKQQLTQAEEALVATQCELQEKANELVQSEQRVSSIREKLGIAVAKGKGLVTQRDNLKQSLAETSSELERCSRELQLKDARLHEVEATMKTYLEAGERVEALESELSYIRNSATALRESFLLKDSVLQRIEEILEDLELPEDFHSRDIIEKVDWLARSASVNSLPPTDWDRKSSIGGSYSDASHIVKDSWKEEVQPGMTSGDDLRRKYEELQNQFYGLAEQNEMLEQSLMERNHLVQRWEEMLGSINMPSHLRSLEPEDRIEWLGSALLEANHDRNSLLEKIDNLESHCASIVSDLEESQHRISLLNVGLEDCERRKSDLEMELEAVVHERDSLSKRLGILTSSHEKFAAKVVQYELDVKTLQNEVTSLEEELLEKCGNEEYLKNIDNRISRLKDLLFDTMHEPDAKDLPSLGSNLDCLEVLLGKLMDEYMTVALNKQVLGGTVDEHYMEKAYASPIGGTRDTIECKGSDVGLLKSDKRDVEEPNVDSLKKHQEEILSQLNDVKEERDRYMEMQKSLAVEVETLNKRSLELQELLNLEEQKSNSFREKLNVAVRKGKSVVQQRDILKQNVEGLNNELECLKSEIKQRENAVTEYEQQMKDLMIYSEKVGTLESENSLLRDQLAETKHVLQEKELSLTMVLGTLRDIDVGGEFSSSDPFEKLKHIGKLCQDLHEAVTSLEQDSRKSRRAAELLLAELNEVQDRNDHLQEELVKTTEELSELSKERDVAGAAEAEALSRLEKLSLARSEEQKKLYSGLLTVKSATIQFRKGFSDINSLLAGLFHKDLGFLQNLEAGMESCLRSLEPDHMVYEPLFDTSSNSGSEDNRLFADFLFETDAPDHFDGNFIIDLCSSVQECVKEVGAFKVMLHEHSISLHQQASNLSKLIRVCHREMTSQRESYDALKKELKHVESIEEEKEREVVFLRRNLSLLYEACTGFLMEIEKMKAEAMTKRSDVGSLEMVAKPSIFADGGLPSRWEKAPSEEHINAVVDRLLSSMKSFPSLIDEFFEGDKKEMKITISNLQKELQEKDAQRETIYMELVSQIKEAEAAARGYSLDLQSSKTYVVELEKQVALMEDQRSLLEQRVKELQDGQAISAELQEKIKSLTDTVAFKDNEIEALMQALDEEEVQMEDLRSKIEELEKVLQQKSLDVENLEASRAKVLKKLSVTVSKFDELHQFSESLLAEVEKLQLQVRDRDAEISFLRQEVTRCTNEVLVASQMSSEKSSDEIHEILTWLDVALSQAAMQDVMLKDGSHVHEYKEILQKKIASVLSQLEDLQVMAQSKDELLQTERGKVEELTRREEILEKALREKDSRLNMLEEIGDSGRPASSASEILEVEPVMNKWTVPGPAASSQVRSLRKANNDQVAIAIDMDAGGGNHLEDEDDDKVHGFKSLTTSRIVPKFTRPVSDMIDGLWVSCDRALMRQPALRLGIMIYWALLHALLATFVF